MTVKVFGNLMDRTFRNERKFQIGVQENFFDFLPRAFKKPLYKPYLKRILMDKYGPKAFLFPDTLMFPIVNINTGQVDARLVQYALIRAIMLRRISHDFDYIYERAKKCYIQYKDQCKPCSITLLGTGEQINLLDFLEKLNSFDGYMEFELPDDAKLPPKPNPHIKPGHWHYNRKFKRLDKTATKKI